MIREEEEQFLRNLENGLKLLNDTFRQDEGGRLRHDRRARRRSSCTPPTAFPIEITESLATDQNLRVDMAGSRRPRMKHAQDLPRHRPRPPPSSPPARSTRSRSRTTTATSSSATRPPRPTARSSASSSKNQLADSATVPDGRPADRRWSSTARRSTARAAARSATPATIRGDGFVFEVDGHQEGQRLHAPHRAG